MKQLEDSIFITQEGYAKEVLKKFNMFECKHVNTLMECGTKLSKLDGQENVDPTLFINLIRSLRYLSCTRPDISFAVELVNCFMEKPSNVHMKTTKRILCYIKGTLDYGMFFSSPKEFNLMIYWNSDFARDIDDQKSTTSFVFFLGNNVIAWY